MDIKVLLHGLGSIPPPPGYAKALSTQYQELKYFLESFDPKDPEMVKRLKRRSSDIQYLIDDMKKANIEASNSKLFPMVMIPSGIWAEILGRGHEKPEDGEHWPEDRRDGPITWKK